MGDTGIEWTDATWNPVIGCSRISEGCRHCYAEVQAARIVRMGKGKPTPYDDVVKLVTHDVRQYAIVDGRPTGKFRTVSVTEPRWTGVVRLVPERLAWPLTRRKPLRIFVNSMSDLFHESLSNEQIAAVFGVMAACPQHTFQILTKRARRMREWFEWVGDHGPQGARSACRVSASSYIGRPAESTIPPAGGFRWPLLNVWIGVSVENQAAAIERIPDLERTPAAVRLLSIEPMLGPVDLERWLWRPAAEGFDWPSGAPRSEEYEARYVLHWVIAGCESGPGARPCDVAWLRSLRDQCAAADVAFFLKQARHTIEPGTYPKVGENHIDVIGAGPISHRKPGGIIGAPYLDGVQHLAFPKVRHG